MRKRRAIVNRELGIALIPLGGKKYPGRFALVDAWLAPFLEMFNWQPGEAVARTLYAKGYVSGRGTIRMHILLCPANGLDVDHINGNPLDNRLSNLRPCTRAQNSWNKHGTLKRKYRGVQYVRPLRLWRVQFTHNYERVLVGYYPTEDSAARAHDSVVRRLRGEFARLNFPDEIRDIGPVLPD